jgi:hypothetical protein
MLRIGAGIQLTTVLLFLLTTGSGPSVLTRTDRIVCPNGAILSAAFSAPGHIVVQTELDVYPQGNKAQKPMVRRFLAIYGTKEKTWIRSVVSEDDNKDGARRTIGGCGRILYILSSNSLLVCEGDHVVRVRDAETLQVQKEIHLNPEIHARDVTASYDQGIFYVVGTKQNGSIILDRYSTASGNLTGETELSTASEQVMLSMALENAGRVIAIAVNDPENKDRMQGGVIVCNNPAATISCMAFPQKHGVAQTAFLNQGSVLFIFSEFADRTDRGDCIRQMNLATHEVDAHAFCKPEAGVHYALAVVGQDLVVGFTGYANRNLFTENIKGVNNSASVWDAESKHLIAVTGSMENYGAYQADVRIVTDHGQHQLIVFQRLTGAMSLYELPFSTGVSSFARSVAQPLN